MRCWPTVLEAIDWYFESTALHICLGGGLVFCLIMAGCATQSPKQIVQYQTVEVPKYIRTPISAQYMNDCIVNEPAPACGKLYCNGQVAVMIDDFRGALRQCNADKAALRSLQPQPEDSH